MKTDIRYNKVKLVYILYWFRREKINIWWFGRLRVIVFYLKFKAWLEINARNTRTLCSSRFALLLYAHMQQFSLFLYGLQVVNTGCCTWVMKRETIRRFQNQRRTSHICLSANNPRRELNYELAAYFYSVIIINQ